VLPQVKASALLAATINEAPASASMKTNRAAIEPSLDDDVTVAASIGMRR
jgi:hypothetical protein